LLNKYGLVSTRVKKGKVKINKKSEDPKEKYPQLQKIPSGAFMPSMMRDRVGL